MAAILDFRPERFYLFLIYKSLRCFLPSFKSVGLLVQEKKRKIDFQDSRNGGHFGFPIGTILLIFLSTSHSDASYQVKWPRGVGGVGFERKLLTPHDGRGKQDDGH